MYIGVDAIKRHLNIDHDFDDEYLLELIPVAEDAVSEHIKQDLTSLEVEGVLPSRLLHAIRLKVGNLYNNRESITYGAPVHVPLTYHYLLQPFKKYKRNAVGTT